MIIFTQKLFGFIKIATSIVALFILFGCATGSRYAMHWFGFDTTADNQNAVVLNYRYGSSKGGGIQPPAWSLANGTGYTFQGVRQMMRPGEILYVKWRDKSDGAIYERTVDLRKLLPENIEDQRVHFTVKGAHLTVYLISPELRPKGEPRSGPSEYQHNSMMILYQD